MRFGRRAETAAPEESAAPTPPAKPDGSADRTAGTALPTATPASASLAPALTSPGRPLTTTLARAQAAKFTGSLRVSNGTRSADVFLFEGGVYAVTAPDFRPHVLRRLRSSGAAIPAHASDDPGAVAELVDDGNLTATDVAVVHQELMLAFLGTLITWPGSGSLEMPGSITDVRCTLPVTWEILKPLLDNRALRHVADCTRLGCTGTPARASALAGALVLAPVGDLPTGGPEAAALWAALGGGVTLDQAAGRCGFTRAEASHLAANLMESGSLERLPAGPPTETHPLADASGAVYDVPEAWASADILSP